MATAKYILDTRTKIKTGQHPIKIYVYNNGEERKFKTPFHATIEEFDNLPESKKHDDKHAMKTLRKMVSDAESICNKLNGRFTWTKFKFMFDSGVEYEEIKEATLSVTNEYQKAIVKLEKNEQFYMSTSFKNSLKSLTTFGGEKLTLWDIDKNFLKDWERAIIKGNGIKQNSPTTVSTYMRPLRMVFNYAIGEKLLPIQLFPFGKFGYKIKNSHSAEADLHPIDIKKFWDYQPADVNEQQAKDFWFFSLFCNGIAPIDISFLTQKNIVYTGGVKKIVYSRNKTRLSVSKKITVEVKVNKNIQEILDRQELPAYENFLFPIRFTNQDAKKQMQSFLNWSSWMRKTLRKIGKKLKLEKPLKPYAARHSFMSELGSKGYNEHTIALLAGNNNSSMAKNYMGKVRKEVSEKAAEDINKLVA